MAVTTVLALVVLLVSYLIYQRAKNLPVADEAQVGLTKLFAHKFYVDEIYNFLFVRSTERLSKLLHYYVDVWAIDGLVNGVGKGVENIGAQFRKLQNGNIEYYLIGMVAGAILLVLTMYL
jgi:NADH-quinone oxidoreductase subunit L